MRNNTLNIFNVFCIFLLIFLFSCKDGSNSANTTTKTEYKIQVVMNEVSRFNTDNSEHAISVQKELETSEATVPENLSTAGGWAITEIMCEEGGYNLGEYTEETVFISEYDIGEDCGDYKLHLIAISDGSSCICLYMREVHEEGHIAAPGTGSVFHRCGE